jgi:hypothetical protein
MRQVVWPLRLKSWRKGLISHDFIEYIYVNNIAQFDDLNFLIFRLKLVNR